MAINNAINQYPIVDALLGTWTPGAGTITSADSILTALQKISGSSVALSGNNVWTGTNSFGNTVTFSTLTASTVPYLDASKTLTSSAVTPTELGYVSGVTSAIQTQLNAKASGSGYTASRVMISDGTGALVVSPDITTTELGYLNGATGTTGTGNLVFSASPTFTGTVTFSDLTASTVPYLNASKALVSSAVTPTQLGYLGSATGTTGTASTNLVFSASPTFTGTVTVAALYAGAGTFTDRIQVSGNISFPGAASGNGYIYHANNLGLVIYGEGTSLDLLFANKSGGTVMSVTTNTQNVDFAGAVTVVSNVTIGGQATATSVGLEIGNTAGGTPFIDFKSSAIDYDVRIINGASNVLSFLGGSGGYFFDATVNSIYSIVATTATATLTTITQGITIAGNLVTSAYLSDGYTAGLTWSNTDDNAAKPKAGIFSRTTAGGSYLYLGTSASYATGITNLVSITPTGGIDCAAITATSLVATSPVTSGTALQVTASSLTSGNGIYVYSNSSSASQFIMLNLTSANASATGMIPLAIANAASVSTNYKIMMFLGGVFIWKSAGVTPNGNLTGTAGDICLGADSGKAYYCGGGTTWTAM